MNAKNFSDAMNEIDDKYIDEALFTMEKQAVQGGPVAFPLRW